jgi:hypothetical protein
MQTALAIRTEKALEINGFDEAVKLAEIMATAKLVPTHLQKSPADCLLVIEQAIRWGMSPFAVAQATSIVSGKLMFEGKLVAAAIQGSGVIHGNLNYVYKGEGDKREVTVSGILRGEQEARTITARFKDVRTENKHWDKNPDQMLSYMGARIWARRHAPAVMLGVYAPDEFEDKEAKAPRIKKEVLATCEDGSRLITETPVTDEAPAPVNGAVIIPAAGVAITPEQLKEINFLLKELKYTKEKKAAWGNEVKALYNVAKPTELSQDDAEAVIANLNHELDLVAADNNPFKEPATVAGGPR